MKKNIMKRAWEIARQGQKSFGGSVKSYFSESLKMAWNNYKNGGSKMEITGTEKQVKWATDIKNNALSFIDEYKNELSALIEEKKNSIEKKKQAGKTYEFSTRELDAIIEMVEIIENLNNAAEIINLKGCLSFDAVNAERQGFPSIQGQLRTAALFLKYGAGNPKGKIIRGFNAVK